MASPTSPAIAAQTVSDETPNGQPARLACGSAATMMAPDTELNTTLPDSRASTQHTSSDPLRNPQRNNNDNDGSHAPAAPNREPDGRLGENDEAPESSSHDPIGAHSSSLAADSNALRSQPPYLADAHPTETNVVGISPEPMPELHAQDPPASSAATVDGAQPEATAAVPGPAHDSAATLPLPPFASPPVPPPYWTHSRDGSNEGNGLNENASFDATRPAMAVLPSTKKPAGGAAPMFSPPFLRRLDGSSRGQTSSSAPPFPPSSAQRPATSTTQSSSIAGGSDSRNHRRETSSSTLDFSANMITLQDNEALDEEEEEGGEISSSGWKANGSASSAMSPAAGWPSPGPSSTSSTSGLAAPPTASASATRKASNSSKANRCWARRIDITDHTIIGAGGSGSKAALPKMGAFVVWTIRVQTLDSITVAGGGGGGRSPPSSSQQSPVAGHSFSVYKRYSEFDTLRQRLVASFPQARGGGALPPLPPKTVLGNFRPDFLEKRRTGLQYFLNCILLNPEFAGSPILQDFLFS
ncbi:hypothetical protein SEPCBS57363_000360 [Sporothrix epigloea]|uniref:Endosomal/vacuolar adapter protein YPT35 n=1 Tax=Sporothrix epigloea TaxID=1892477 RepID=A0ABP0D481_9PEZI